MNTILNSLVAPELHDPIRLPSYPVIERTSVLGFNVPASVELPGEETRMLITRQPVFPVWADQQATGFVNGATWRSTTLPASGGAPAVVNVDFVRNFDATFTGTRMPGIPAAPSIGVAGGATGVLPYSSNAPLVGVTADRNYIYVPANYLVAVVAGNYTGTSAAATTASITLLERVTDEDARSSVALTVSASKTAGEVSLPASSVDRWFSVVDMTLQAAASLTINESYFVTIMAVGGTYTYASSSTGGDHGTVTVTAANVIGMLPLAMAPDFGVTSVPWRACRTTAMGVALTNISPVLVKSGSILAGRVDPLRLWPWSLAKGNVANLHKADKCLSSLQNGFYTYVPPSTDVAGFEDYTEINDRQTSIMPVFRLDNYSMCHILFLSNLSSDSQSLTASVSWHLEFRNTSTLFPINIARTTIEVMHQAQLKMMTMGFFHPNSNIPAVLKGSFKGGLDEKRPSTRIGPSKLMTETKSPVRQSGRNVRNPPRRNRRRRNGNQPRNNAPRPKTNQQSQKRKGGLQMYLDSRK